jgi:hypothetical protein
MGSSDRPSVTREEWLDRWLARAPILTEDQVDEILELMNLK